MKKLRILHVVDHLSQGGAQEGLRDLLEAQDAQFEHHLFSLRRSKQDKEIASERLHCSRSKSRFSLLPVLEFIRLDKQLRPELTHAHLIRSQLLCTFLRTLRLTSSPLIIHERGLLLMKAQVLALLLRLLSSAANAFICVSEAAKAATISRLALSGREDEVYTLRNGIRLEHIRNKATEYEVAASGEFHVCFAGRLEVEKGCSVLLDALAQCSGEITVSILGDGSLRENLEAQCRELEFAARLEFRGNLSNPLPIIAAADVLVVPSFSDALPRSIIEAFALGTTVIASKVGGIPEMVVHEQTGLLFDAGDSQALAEAITRLQVEPALLERLSQQAKVESENYSFESFQSRLGEMYKDILQKHQSA